MTRGLIASLRDIVPLRPLTRTETMVIAERQATRFRHLVGAAEDMLNEATIIDLPRVEVRRHSPWPSSGAAQWIDGRWVIVLNASEPAVRQRFSLCHELKHIVDHRFVELNYRHLDDHTRLRFIESTCDYFAGCLLMPRPALKQAYVSGCQQPDRLARRFGVSEAAIATRLWQIGLTRPTPRCLPPRRSAAGGDAHRSVYTRARPTRTSRPYSTARATTENTRQS